jgi:hypothetical protein
MHTKHYKMLSLTPDIKGFNIRKSDIRTLSPLDSVRKRLFKHYIPKVNEIKSMPESPSFISGPVKKRMKVNSIFSCSIREAKKRKESVPHAINLELAQSLTDEQYRNMRKSAHGRRMETQLIYYKISHKLNPVTSALGKVARQRFDLFVKGSQLSN